MNEIDFQNEIASHIGKLLRDAFGKGPQAIYVSVERPFITVYLRNFLTSTEKILLNQGQIATVQQIRDVVMSSLIPEIKAYLVHLTGMNDLELYYDWDLNHHSGIFVGREIHNSDELLTELPGDYGGKEELHREIIGMSRRIQKKPAQIDSRMLNKRTLAVVRSGILTDLSKELIRTADKETLKQTVIRLEKKHLHEHKYIEQLLNSRISDIFIDWNLKQDDSVIVFILNPK